MVLAGGTENMSQAPQVVRGSRNGFKLGHAEFTDALRECLYDPYAGCEMAITAENLGEKYGITREDADAYGLRSQLAWTNAFDNGYYNNEITPVTIKGDGDTVVEIDEHPQLTDWESKPCPFRRYALAQARVRPVFKKDGTVTQQMHLESTTVLVLWS